MIVIKITRATLLMKAAQRVSLFVYSNRYNCSTATWTGRATCAAPHRVGSAGQAKQALNASTARHRISCQAA